MRKTGAALLAIAWLTGGPCTAKPPDLPLQYERFALANGLTVIVNEDHASPLVTVRVVYRVGSRNEPVGQTGFAHLFEHLMFNGTEHFDGEWMAPLLEVGATPAPYMGGETGRDWTNYFQTVPTSALDRVLWMESDRMGHLLGAITQARLDEQRGIVQNEVRQFENEPYGRIEDRLYEGLFPPEHPYHHRIYGSMADLETASLQQVHQWFKDYYGPQNAVIVLSGDVDLATAREKVSRYFADIPPGPAVDRWAQWVPTRAQATSEIQYDTVGSVRLARAWVIPGRTTRDFALLSVVAAILGEGRSSLLATELVRKQQLASTATAFANPLQLAGVLTLQVDLRPDVRRTIVEDALDGVIEDFVERGPSRAQVERAVATLSVRQLGFVSGGYGRASTLADGELIAADPAFLSQYLQWIESCTPDSLREVARQYLRGNWHQVEVLPRASLKAEGAGVDRSRGMPALTEVPREVGFPAVQTATLANGAKLAVAARHNATQLYVSVQFDAGNAADPPGHPGLASFTLDLLDEGTSSRDAQSLSVQLERLGAEINFENDLDRSAVTLVALPDRVGPSVALWAEMIQHAALTADAIERVRSERLAALKNEQTDPERLAIRLLREAVFGAGHPYGIPRSGLAGEASLRAVRREGLLEFRRNWFRPDNATILVVGDLSLEKARALIEPVLSHWGAPDAPLPRKNLPQVKPPDSPRIILVDRPGAPQSLILGGTLAPSSTVTNDLAIEVANKVLGDGFTSRLNLKLREAKHWSYGAGSGMADARGPRLFQVNAPVQTDKTAAALTELIGELHAINGDRPITEAEMKSVIGATTRQLPGYYETAAAILYGGLHTANALGRPLDYPNELVRRYQALTLGDVREAAREVVRPENMIWIVIGDSRRIRNELAGLHIGLVEAQR